MEIRVGRNFRILRKLGSGSFGEIWRGIDVLTGHEVAIKLEHIKRNAPHLLNETKINKILEGSPGIPKVHWYGCQGDYVVLVMDLMGPSIEDLFNMCGRQLCLSTVSMIGSQMIDRLETVHNLGVIHRDIKPHNFLMGKNQTDKQVCVIDFGLAKRYKDVATGIHIPYREGKCLTGTARYVSVSTHLGIEQSRRDDLESVGYLLLYLLKGSLPWQGLKAMNKKEKYERISLKKLLTPLDVLCKGYPEAIANYLSYTRALKFVERPNYDWLRDAIRSIFYFDPIIVTALDWDLQWDDTGALIINKDAKDTGNSDKTEEERSVAVQKALAICREYEWVRTEKSMQKRNMEKQYEAATHVPESLPTKADSRVDQCDDEDTIRPEQSERTEAEEPRDSVGNKGVDKHNDEGIIPQ